MCTCESISPGTAVVRPASMTTSQASTSLADAVPTATIRSPSVTMVSPLARGSVRSPVTIVPILTMATRMVSPPGSRAVAQQLLLRAADGRFEAEARQQPIHQISRLTPSISSEAVACGHELRPGIEHFVLGVTGAEFRADGVPCRLEKFHLAFRVERRRALRLADDRRKRRIGPVPERGRQHDERASRQFANDVDHFRIEILRHDLRRVKL